MGGICLHSKCSKPTMAPTHTPSGPPTRWPTFIPSYTPTPSPSAPVTAIPTAKPSRYPTLHPTSLPTGTPTSTYPTPSPTSPTPSPTHVRMKPLTQHSISFHRVTDCKLGFVKRETCIGNAKCCVGLQCISCSRAKRLKKLWHNK